MPIRRNRKPSSSSSSTTEEISRSPSRSSQTQWPRSASKPSSAASAKSPRQDVRRVEIRRTGSRDDPWKKEIVVHATRPSRPRQTAEKSHIPMIPDAEPYTVNDSRVWQFHYCSLCGRYRSREYHKVNPIFPGDRPIVKVCSRCVSPMLAYPPCIWRASGRIVGERNMETEEILIYRKAPTKESTSEHYRKPTIPPKTVIPSCSSSDSEEKSETCAVVSRDSRSRSSAEGKKAYTIVRRRADKDKRTIMG